MYKLAIRYHRSSSYPAPDPTLELIEKEKGLADPKTRSSDMVSLPRNLTLAERALLRRLLESEEGRRLVQKLSQNGFALGMSMSSR